MRFVTPDVVRIPLKNGEWIEIKRELTVGEEKRFRSAGLKNMKAEDGGSSIEIDWTAMALARVETYLLEWSATRTDAAGKTVSVPVTRKNIEALTQDDFDEIDQAIQAHIEQTSGGPAGAQSGKKKAGGKTPSS